MLSSRPAFFACGNNAPLQLEAQHPQYALVQPLLGDGSVLHRLGEGADGLVQILGAQQQIHPRLDGGHGDLAAAVVVGHGPHLQAVGDDHAVKAQLLPQKAGDHRMGEQGGLLVDSGHDEVAQHHRVRARFNARPEGDKLRAAQLVQGFIHVHRAVMTVGGGVPVAGEVLEGAGHAALVEAAHGGRHQLGGLVKVVAVGPVADDGVGPVGPHVGHRGEIHVEAAAAQVGGDGAGVFRGLIRPLVLVVQHGAHVGGADGMHQAVDPPALLIAGKDEGDFGVALDACKHGLGLLHGDQVGVVQQPRHRVALQRRPGGFPRRRHPGHPGDGGRLDHQQLAGFFIQGHPCKQLLRRVGGVLSKVSGKWP